MKEKSEKKMKIIYDIFHQEEKIKNSYVAIGNFDGVHLGHRKLIESIVEKAKKNGGVSVVYTFLNHPRAFINKKENLEHINTLEEKLYILERLEVDYVVLQDFTDEFCNLTGDEFVEKLLIHELGAKKICVGFNFRYGKGKSHGIEELREICKNHKVDFREIPPVKIDGKTISSTIIREKIKRGELAYANRLLGDEYLIIGKVIHGKKLGRTLGFPTANLEMGEQRCIPYGVYGGYGYIEGDEKEYDIIVNIGKNPTLKLGERTIEAHILDFKGDIYGKKIYIRFVKHIRNEQKFSGANELKAQIFKDIEYWREYLKNINNGVDYGDNT